MANRTSASQSNQSGLSSAMSDPESFFEAEGEAKRILDERDAEGEGEHLNILRNFMQVLPHQGRKNLCDDIISCEDRLLELKTSIIWSLVIPMKARGRTPAITPSPRADADADVNRVAAAIEPSQRTVKLKNDCLERDGWKCVVSGLYDSVAAAMIETPEDSMAEESECAHIIPFTYANFSPSQTHQHSMIWDSLLRYFPTIEGRLRPQTINSHENAMTLYHGMHRHFGNFRFALEDTDTPNVYSLRVYKVLPSFVRLALPQDRMVRMVSHKLEYPLPDPSLLRVHAAIAKFLHINGMGERIDKIMRDRENIRCLATDSSTNIEMLLAF